MAKKLFWTVIFLLFLGTGTIYAQNQAPAPSPKQDTDYIIGLEDVLAINVWKDPELSLKEVVVRPDGKISLPLAGNIQAEGMTVKQLQDAISEKLKDYVTAPVVTVTVVKILSKSVSVVGQVQKSGIFSLGSPMTVMELLARAGGLTLDAKPKKIKIIRMENGKTITIPFNYNDMINGKDLKQNVFLQNGDVLVVP
jgi:polysaccharide export outer membrane protein